MQYVIIMGHRHVYETIDEKHASLPAGLVLSVGKDTEHNCTLEPCDSPHVVVYMENKNKAEEYMGTQKTKRLQGRLFTLRQT